MTPPSFHLKNIRAVFTPAAYHLAIACLLAIGCSLVGCNDQSATVREIQSQQQAALQASQQQDHLGETIDLLSQFAMLNEIKASRQVVYHLNAWRESSDKKSEVPSPELIDTLTDVLPRDAIAAEVERADFTIGDVSLLRDSYVMRQVVSWIDTPLRDDPIFNEWLTQQSKTIGEEPAGQLRVAARLFDWVVRNVSLEPDVATPQQFANFGPLPLGMQLEGPGYRQSNYQTLWRGRGDGLQRAGVFTQLCLQANLPAAVLATQDPQTGQLQPWCVGVLIDKEIYLFEPRLGLPIPGPEQTGIATLAQARDDASVLRRLNVAGYFDYPLSRTDIQQNVALLNVRPERLSARMKGLEDALTGDRRMTVFVDAKSYEENFDAVSGIAGVRLWSVPLLAEIYAVEMSRMAQRDPLFGFWYVSRWAMLESGSEQAQNLARGRWNHLLGKFVDNEMENDLGARTLYLAQRAPEFEIDDLRIDVELQKSYGVRRELGMTTEQYEALLQQIQTLMRLGKQTASYWLSLVQYDDGRLETAANWFEKRVLDTEQQSMWVSGATYSFARTLEQTEEVTRAVELLKQDNTPAAHGNRLRARLLER